MAFAKLPVELPEDAEPKVAGLIVALSVLGLAVLRKITK